MQAELQKATSVNALLWAGGKVYYEMDPDLVPNFLQTIIREAMDEYEQHTCLKFYLKNSKSTQFIRFQYNSDGCYSTSVGKEGGIQTINIHPGCAEHSGLLHEIGHAIGFWHEQSRPDRDNYVTINWDNIQEGLASQFNLRHEVDYQGEEYDYASIMHYDVYAFSKNEQPTMAVNNLVRYQQQGRPHLGIPWLGLKHLSAGDIRLVNKLYKCYNPYGFWGFINVHVYKATGLPQGTYYAQITAYGGYGTKRIYESRDSENNSPAVYTWEDGFSISYFISAWRYFEIKIKNLQGGDVISRQTIWIEKSREKVEDAYCMKDKEDQNRNKCVFFNYEIKGF